MRWVLLDEILEIQKGQYAKSRSHIPALEASAEVLMIEMMAQTGGLLVGAESNFQSNLIFAKIETAEFHGEYGPGDAIEISAAAENLKADGSWIDGEVIKNGELIARSRILLMNAGEIVPGKKASITFHEEFMKHFKVLEKIK